MATHYIHQMIYLQNKRGENMDRYLVERRRVGDVPLELYVVCDGVGSTPRGGETAQDVVNCLWDWFYGVDCVEDIFQGLLTAVYGLNKTLFQKEVEGALQRGATTLVALLLVGGTFFVVNVGDSRIYARETEQWLQLTTDQVLGGALTQAIPKEQIFPEYWGGETKFTHFLLASDGFYRRLPWEKVEENLCEFGSSGGFLEEIAQILIEKGEKDNITGILVGPEEGV